jgi:hypothetical protein
MSPPIPSKLSDILNWAKRYRLTEKDMEVVRYMEESYDKKLYEFLNNNNITILCFVIKDFYSNNLSGYLFKPYHNQN